MQPDERRIGRVVALGDGYAILEHLNDDGTVEHIAYPAETLTICDPLDGE